MTTSTSIVDQPSLENARELSRDGNSRVMVSEKSSNLFFTQRHYMYVVNDKITAHISGYSVIGIPVFKYVQIKAGTNGELETIAHSMILDLNSKGMKAVPYTDRQIDLG